MRKSKYLSFIILSYLTINNKNCFGILYPQDSETRNLKSLDGIWNFVPSNVKDPNEGLKYRWFLQDLSQVASVINMPVPSSYNDITQDHNLHDHVGTVWYDRRFFVPKSWNNDTIVWIRFGSVHYKAIVWINGKEVVSHEMGHLPFEANITNVLKFGDENLITVLCDNTLNDTTIPQGKVEELPTDDGTTLIQTYAFDFFNYAGIHRSVFVYTTPKEFIQDIYVSSEVISNDICRVNYNLNITDSAKSNLILVRILDKNGTVIAQQVNKSCTMVADHIEINKPILWWPYLMGPSPGYLYTMEVQIQIENTIIDVYRLKFGIRALKWDSTSFLINGVPVYFRGFGRHEDSDIRGKGLDLALLTKDFNLIKWIGANSYRTSHYPYSEESMQFADEHGIMIINECASVNTAHFSSKLLHNHKSSLEQLFLRDRNHPSVVMWSVANEPRSQQRAADSYFKEVIKSMKILDPNRPVSFATSMNPSIDLAVRYVDIICFNKYFGWYDNTGRLDMITSNVIENATFWHSKFEKPVIMTEYGADSIAGIHTSPPTVWSEEYQELLLEKHFKAFDKLRNAGFFIGEFIWNFADFKTNEKTIRDDGNKKGMFTRQRQPKEAAFYLRRRYFSLAYLENNMVMPNDIYVYVSAKNDTVYV